MCATAFSRSGIPAEDTSAHLADDEASLHGCGPLFSQILSDQIEHGGEGAEVVVCLDMEF